MSKTTFRNQAAEFVYIRTYSRWIPDLLRRETWEETVNRYVNFIEKHRGDKIPHKVLKKIKHYMLTFNVMPSMRAVWAAGEAAEFDNTTMYNCAFQCIDSPLAFAENLYILMCGTGYGYRVLKEDVEKLPVVPNISSMGAGIHVVEDSRAGWANSLKELIISLYSGKDLDMDYSKVRPAGSRLKTMGGRASGPEPLMKLHNFVRDVFMKAQGRKLTTLECSDICNQIAEIVVVGGVRRSSEIGLSDLDDDLMRYAKKPPFPAHRYMFNSSAVYKEKPSAVDFLKEWGELAASCSGERGIFNLAGAKLRSPKRRNSDLICGVNPCSEILLRNQQFCNLSEVVVRVDDDLDDLMDKVETATWIGVIQSTFTHFPYLNHKWKENCEEERLLGVSLTGQMDAPHLMTEDSLKALKNKAIKVAKKASEIMGINMPTAITCVKPSGTVSQLVDSSSGLHARFSRYYIRRYRISASDALFKMLKSQGIPLSPENAQREKDWKEAENIYKQTGSIIKAREKCTIFNENSEWSEDKVNTWVISFPIKAPDNAIIVDDLTAIDQLEWYKKIQTNWCEHNASITVYVKDHEWFEVGNWVYKNWDIVNGISFLPYDGGIYEQMPYEKITKEQYEKMIAEQKTIDYSQLSKFEIEDSTQGRQELACTGGTCELP